MHSLPPEKYNRNFLPAFVKANIGNTCAIEDKLIQKMKSKMQEEQSVFLKKENNIHPEIRHL